MLQILNLSSCRAPRILAAHRSVFVRQEVTPSSVQEKSAVGTTVCVLTQNMRPLKITLFHAAILLLISVAGGESPILIMQLKVSGVSSLL